jgi:PAS domain S-box-containing protein
MAEILGTTTHKLAGQQSFDFIYPEDLPAATRLFEMKKAGDTAPFQFRLRRADGTPIWVQVQGTPMHDKSEMLGIIGTFDVINAPEDV